MKIALLLNQARSGLRGKIPDRALEQSIKRRNRTRRVGTTNVFTPHSFKLWASPPPGINALLGARFFIGSHFGNGLHRSHSPITKSTEPRIVTTSLIMWPGRIAGKMLRFTNEGARIFIR